AIEAIGAGKNVVVEKPMAMNLEEADSMIKAAKYSKLMLTTILNNRFLPACSFLKRSIDEDILGRILSSSVNVLWYRPQSYYNESKWRGTTSMDGGVLLNQAIHHVDLMLWYLGDVEKVEAYFDALGHEIEAIDTAVAIVKFKSNAIGTINATTCAYPRNLEETITIIGEKGSVILGGSTLNDFRVWRVDGIPEEDVYNSIRKVETPKWYGHYKQIEDVCLAIIDGREPTVKSTDGRIALELFQRISNMDSVHSS
ncbi:MAG: Gfo/Idh/MocA family oxidoreductase, partial [Gammaproteobacteria bacterium]|nr:Gfo/Idh/MocA family oxidoreductase [Gammaproteobacteria bacterium]